MNSTQNLVLSREECTKIYESILNLLAELTSVENDEYLNTNITNVTYDKETEENVLRLVRHHEI